MKLLRSKDILQTATQQGHLLRKDMCSSAFVCLKLDFRESTKLVQLDTPQSEFVAEHHLDICRVGKKF